MRIKNIGLLSIALLMASSASALDVQLFQPNLVHQQSLTQYGSQGLGQGNFGASLLFNLDYKPLEFGLFNQSRSDQIVDWFYTINTQFGYGFSDRVSLLVDMPFNIYSKVENIQSTVTTKDPSLGDLRLSVPLSLIQASREDRNFGVGFVPFLTFNTGADNDFFGNPGYIGSIISTLGGKLVLDRYIGNRSYLSLNIGARFREDEMIANSLDVGHEFLTGLGYVLELGKAQTLDLMVDVYGHTQFKDFYTEENSSPLDTTLGLRKRFNHVAAMVGGGIAVNNGYGAPDWRLFAGIAYVPGGEKRKRNENLTPTTEDSGESEDSMDVAETNLDEAQLEEIIVYFDNNQSSLDAGDRSQLQRFYNTLKSGEKRIIVVQGHTDQVGSNEYNLALSESRAKEVAQYLRDLGLENEKIKIEAFGEEKPAVSPSEFGRAPLNRRVEIH